MQGIENVKRVGLALQINFTATKYNLDHLEDTINMVDDLGADIMLVYQLVCVGRGQNVGESALEKMDNNKLPSLIANRQKLSRTVIEPVAAPQFNEICGGCRGMAWTSTGDYLAEDPSCFI